MKLLDYSKLGSDGQFVVVLDDCNSGTVSRGVVDRVHGMREGITRPAEFGVYGDTSDSLMLCDN